MFDVGFTELLLVFVIGLLILGPERLPRVAAQLGRWVGRARRTANQLRYQLEREIALEEIQRAQKSRPKTEPRKPPGDEAAAAPAPDAAAAEAPHPQPPHVQPPASSPAAPPAAAGSPTAAPEARAPDVAAGAPADALDTERAREKESVTQ